MKFDIKNLKILWNKMVDIFENPISWHIHFLNIDFKTEVLKSKCFTVYF